MNPVDAAHRRAMELAGQARLERRSGSEKRAQALVLEALQYEEEAARGVPADDDSEPSRSVLHRSAAALAVQCGELGRAERLVCAALAGSPPAEIAEELRALFDEIKFRRTLVGRGLGLSPQEVELRVDGPAVGSGITRSDTITDRVDATQKILTRTAERQRGLPFRDRGRSRLATKDGFQFYLAAAAPGSFAVTLRLGAARDQLELTGCGGVDETIEEAMTCIRLFSEADEEAIAARIPDEAYYRSFMGLAAQLEPDGKLVSVVSVSACQSGEPVSVALRRRARDSRGRRQGKTGGEWEELTGELVSAAKSSRGDQQGSIHLLDADGKEHRVVVLEGMSDLVKAHWDDLVTISGPRKGNAVLLERIWRAEDADDSESR